MTADSTPENFSWHEVAERDAKGLCPASIGYDQPHIPAGDGTCAECGATLPKTPPRYTDTLTHDELAKAVADYVLADESLGSWEQRLQAAALIGIEMKR